MGMYQLDLVLYLDTDDEDNPRIHNSTSPLTDPLNSFRLSDFSTNNISLELRHVTVLAISNCEISEIPNSIQKLNLKQLILTNNKLKEVPSCLYSGLESLELLDLSSNFLTNFEIEPACNSTIVKLKLADNKIANFPHWILTVRCPQLQEVCYNGNFLIRLNAVRELNIQKLEMCNCQLLDVDFMFLKRIKTLEFLDISNDNSGRNENRFKEINGLFNRAKWKNLLVLKLNNLTLSVIPSGIFYYDSIMELHLVGSELNWIPPEISYLKNLTFLDISNNSICSLPEHLTLLPKLSIVRAPFNCISVVCEFTNNLEILDLYSNQLDHIPVSMDRVKLIDLELNYLDTTSIENREDYRKKREEFRGNFDNARITAYCEQPQESESSDDERESSLSDNIDPAIFQYDSDDECWDENQPSNSGVSKNPEVTTSDDEWTGSEEEIKKKPKTSHQYYDEDWFFQDAEEE